MQRILFLCSGGGGNLKFLFRAIHLRAISNFQVCGVITDRKCGAGVFAQGENLEVEQCDFSKSKEEDLLKSIEYFRPDVIVTNVHKILPIQIVHPYRGKLLNLHYSMLPAFGGVIGAKAISQALDYGTKLIGVTSHLVDVEVDAGLPIIQAAIPLNDKEIFDDLMDTAFRVGCISLLVAIHKICNSQYQDNLMLTSTLEIQGRTVLFSPKVPKLALLENKEFWQTLK